MKLNKLACVTFAAGAMAVLAGTIPAAAQSVDALLDKLVDKGILTVKEANELREESDKNFTTALQSKNGMPDWVTALKLNGDLRGRFDGIFINNKSPLYAPSNVDRDRFRYRLRFGAIATLKDDFEVGFRLTSSEPATGSTTGGNPMSGNTTLSGNGSKKLIYIDQAYGRWSPLHSSGWNASLTIGKMENPFAFSDLVFDPDYTPEGAAGQVSYAFTDAHTLKFIGGGFMLNELKASSLDPYLFGAQLRLDSRWSPKLQTSVGVAALNIVNRINLDTAAVPNQNVGNTRVPFGASDFNLLYHYNPVVADGALAYTLDSFPLYNGPFSIKAFGDYMNNPGAPSGKNTGWDAGITFGKSGKKGLWDITYRYRYLESDAWYEELVDDDNGAFYPTAPVGGAAGYGSGTNVKGHIIKVAYSPYDSLTFGITYFLEDLINNPRPSVSSPAGRLFVDAMWKF